jgi:hypothetical protein
MWQGYLDSNQGMAASKAAALPLGDSPTLLVQKLFFQKKYLRTVLLLKRIISL